VGYTGVLRPSLINNFRWGYTRQSIGSIGNSSQPFIYFRGLNDNSNFQQFQPKLSPGQQRFRFPSTTSWMTSPG